MPRRSLPQTELVDLLNELANRGLEGNAAAANILFNLICGPGAAGGEPSPELRAITKRAIASEYFFSGNDIVRAHVAGKLIKTILDQEDDPTLASTIIAKIQAAITAGIQDDGTLGKIMCSIARRYPYILLRDVALYDVIECPRWRWFISNDDDGVRSTIRPLDCVDLELLMGWVRSDPVARARRVAQMLTFARGSGEEQAGDMTWIQTALDLIGIEETAFDVLSEFETRFYFGSWIGSEAHRYARRRSLCEALRNHPNPEVGRWSQGALLRLEGAIRRAEEREHRNSQSFE